ncbi:MAG: hypothetical protein B0W54_15685 [Cellvibrio sp. 79]|nr:MAG: hypothetical protein B0W54_15685 [Cellvibrio sp. 79]
MINVSDSPIHAVNATRAGVETADLEETITLESLDELDEETPTEDDNSLCDSADDDVIEEDVVEEDVIDNPAEDSLDTDDMDNELADETSVGDDGDTTGSLLPPPPPQPVKHKAHTIKNTYIRAI